MKSALPWLAFFALPFLAIAQGEKTGFAPPTDKGATPLSPAHPLTRSPAATRAVVIGISDYQDPAIPDLRFADRDAEAFANFLRSPAGGALDGDHLKVLTNRQATMGKVAAALDWILDVCKEGDQAIIYFSGHGDVERKTISQPGYLLCWDAPPQVYMSGGAFNLRDLEEVVSTLSIQNKVRAIVVADACHAGKLSGAGIGGAQITGASLARQYANEIKILSCQPNEYSIEGEQWGGGRGAFSYHLLDGLLGLADRNADTSVTLSEIDRYLEDHVTPEVAPHRQFPLILGDKAAQLSAVFPEILAELKKGKTGQLAVFSKIDSRGLEEDVLAGVDTSIRELYRLFNAALTDKTFFEPAAACADFYFEKLIAEPKLERLHNTMRRNYAAALQDDAQQAVNNLMKTEKTEVRLYRLERLKKYAPYPRYLARAAELLGPNHYLYRTLQGRKYYFEGTLLHLESPLNPDSLLGRRLLDKYRESLDWQPEAALTYLAMSEVFRQISPNRDSVFSYLDKALELLPEWIAAINSKAHFLAVQNRFEESKAMYIHALSLHPDKPETWVALARAHLFSRNRNIDSMEACLLTALSLDSVYQFTHYWLGVMEYNGRSNFEKSKPHFLKASQADRPDPDVFDYLAIGQEVEQAIECRKKGLEIEPLHFDLNVHLAESYFSINRSDLARVHIQRAMAYDSNSVENLLPLGYTLLRSKIYDEAEKMFQRAVQVDSTSLKALYAVAYLYNATQRFDEAAQQCKKIIERDATFTWPFFLLYDIYWRSGRHAEAKPYVEKLLELEPSNPLYSMIFAKFHSHYNQVDEAFKYLEQALSNGRKDYNLLQKDPDLAPLQALPEWKALMKKHFPGQIKD